MLWNVLGLWLGLPLGLRHEHEQPGFGTTSLQSRATPGRLALSTETHTILRTRPRAHPSWSSPVVNLPRMYGNKDIWLAWPHKNVSNRVGILFFLGGCTLTVGNPFALGIFNSLPPPTLLKHPIFSSPTVFHTPSAVTFKSTQLGSSRAGSDTISPWPTSLPSVHGWIVSSAIVTTSRG